MKNMLIIRIRGHILQLRPIITTSNTDRKNLHSSLPHLLSWLGDLILQTLTICDNNSNLFGSVPCTVFTENIFQRVRQRSTRSRVSAHVLHFFDGSTQIFLVFDLVECEFGSWGSRVLDGGELSVFRADVEVFDEFQEKFLDFFESFGFHGPGPIDNKRDVG
jgi:hypothetical protein